MGERIELSEPVIVRRSHAGATIAALIATGFALHVGQTVFAPVVFALFVIAIVWPIQRALEARMPKILAVLATLLLTIATVCLVVVLLVWGFGRAGQWIVGNAGRFQAIYDQIAAGLEARGFLVGGLLADTFNVGWFVRRAQDIGGRVRGLTSFLVVTFVYVLLGLMEVDITRAKLAALKNRAIAEPLTAACRTIAVKMRTYMLVRTLMSAMTGLVIWVFALMSGLELATAWGVIAFALNYIPFLGPLVATLFPTAFAFVQFESWQMALVVFVVLNLIQFVIGSYLEPRVAGASLSISPFLVLFAVFFWFFLWGIPGAFIGVPVTIAALIVLDVFPSTQWLAQMLSDRAAPG